MLGRFYTVVFQVRDQLIELRSANSEIRNPWHGKFHKKNMAERETRNKGNYRNANEKLGG